jgi:tRNA-modifying protein YgfZ
MSDTENRARLAGLDDRGAVRVSGTDAAKFLQGLLTNDVENLVTAPDDVAFDAAAAHAALLSPQGKILFDFFVVRTVDGFVLDVAQDKAANLAKRLAMYKLRAAVEIADASGSYKMLTLWGPNHVSSGPTRDTIAFKDPRHTDLGTRILAEARFATDIASATNGVRSSAADYHAHRIELGVPEGGKDFAFADIFPHDANYDIFNGVSFTKGCFVGQEIVARMQNKSLPRKRIVRIRGERDLQRGALVLIGDIQIGSVGSIAGRNGLALIRIDRVVEAIDAKQPITAGEVPITIDPEMIDRYRASLSALPA